MKISLTKGSTYISHPTAQVFKKGEVYEVSKQTGEELLTKIDDLGRPFFKQSDDEPATAPEPVGYAPATDGGETEPTLRRRGRPPARDASGEIDTGVAV